MNVSDVVAGLRQPAYTGENRCLPCTAVNVLISVVLAAAVSVVLTPLVGLLSFAVALGVVYLRGYLVPGTPALTKRYLPPRLLRLFGKEPVELVDTPTTTRRTNSADSSEVDATPPADPLVAAGVLTDGGTLTDEFASAWTDRIASVSTVEPADVANVFAASEARETGTTSYVIDGSKSVHWGSTAALLADVAAADLLDARLDEWADTDRDRRQSLLLGLRLCLDTCPDCGASVTHSQSRVDPCCERPHLVADVVCDDCGAALADAAVVDDGTTPTVHERLLLA